MRALVWLSLLGTALAVPKNPHRIVGGTETNIEKYPFMVNLEHLIGFDRWLQYCGGSLINENSVLTAAHCVIGDLPSVWRARLGSSFASSGGTIINTQQIILHEDYVYATFVFDIAILRLSSLATLSDTIALASLGGKNYVLPDDTEITAIGWGSLWSGGPYPEQLREVNLFTINQELCAERYAYLKTLPGFSQWPDVTDDMACAGILDVGGKDACQGDSGGPLIHTTNVIGVTSWGYSCAHAFYPGVYIRVPYNIDWIVENAIN